MCSGILEPDPQDYLFLGGLLIGSKGEVDELGWVAVNRLTRHLGNFCFDFLRIPNINIRRHGGRPPQLKEAPNEDRALD